MVWDAKAEQGEENAKIMWEIVPYTRGLVLDIGCGPHKTFPHFIGVDNRVDTKLFGVQMDPDLTVPDATELRLIASDSCDAVFSSHCLEHIKDYKAALKEWWRVVKPGGHLVLYLPHKRLYPNIGMPGANPDHKHDFMPLDIEQAMIEIANAGANGYELLRNEDRDEGNEYSFFQVYRKREDRTCVGKVLPKRKTAVVVRFGAFGDAIQSAPILAALKREGYYIRLFCSVMTEEALRHDPNVDEFVVHDRDQVPNPWLDWYFDYWVKHTDKFVNLSAIVEQQLLATRDRPHFRWPKAARHALCDYNYVEMMARVAGVESYSALDQKFWPSLEESNWAHRQLEKIPGTGKLVCISMSGSAVHKAWPHIDAVIARILLDYPKWRIALLGGEFDQILEKGWENEDRVWKMSGRIDIRHAMALANVATVCIGAETGTMNAVAFNDRVAKILFLSHSTVENLCRDWLNTCAMVPPAEVHCYPCHMLHTGFDTCWRDEETGVATCQAKISPADVWAAFETATGRRKRENAEPQRLVLAG